MKADVEAAVEELRYTFPEATVSAIPDPDGGAFVTVEPVDPGVKYEQRETWIKFHVTFQYPYSDVYPHFVRPDLRRADGNPLGEGMQPGTSPGDNQPSIQVSRRSNKLDPSIDTASLKLLKVLDWIRTR